ncbi:MAG TPA: type 2 isopentenyl-diphosphate Delta-isomerase [Myxococcota bacterium]|nr:type 2 isopentenyl-diphosphate Delta-isomerase [Myxococcota bacterium]
MDVYVGKSQVETRQQAKLKHVDACLLPASQYQKSAGFEHVTLEHQALAGLALKDVSLATEFLGHKLAAPLMIAPMTGGMERGALLNRRFARAAEHFGLAFGVGSQRLALEDPNVASSFRVRPFAKKALIFANLGAAQLGMNGVVQCLRAVEMIEADALFIHLNPLQEACQEHGDTDFSCVVESIAEAVQALKARSIPVLVREVGFGLSEASARALIGTGISGIDCAGAGGTSWAKVEGLCASSETYRSLGEVFGEWGIPTVQSINNVRNIDGNVPLIAAGGIRSGLDIAKSIALGANLAAMARPMLMAAIAGEHELFSFIEQVLLELRVAMFATGAKTVSELRVGE